jgi:glycosyltransferase involved in cell wall biosynthesis
MKKFHYVAEINLPSKSAYPLHVLKMCDAFAGLKYNVTLLIFYKKNNLSFKDIKKKYNLKNNFKIKYAFNAKKNYNFIDRCKFAFYSIKEIEKNSLIISRSIITSFYLSFNRIENILEIHHVPQKITKIIFWLKKIFINKKYLKFILIHKNLIKKLSLYNERKIVLDDAVDINDFKKVKENAKLQCVYTGSLLKGKGVEVIEKLAELNPKVKFNIYGDKNELNSWTNELLSKKNIFFKNHVDYFQIPKILKRHKVLLMPYQDKVYGLGTDLELSKFMSPMKMFDYLASGRIILASKLNVYSHILKNNYNSILINPNNINLWNIKLNKVLNNSNILKKIRKNSIVTATKNTWLIRVSKIIKFNKY